MKDEINLQDYMASNVRMYGEYYQQFLRIFRTSLKPYWNNLLGFDVIAFDKQFIKSGEGEMQTAVLEKYGQEGVDLIRTLIDTLAYFDGGNKQ